MSDAKEILKKIAKDLLDKANSNHVRFPKIHDESQSMKEIAGFLMARKLDDGGYDIEAAYQSILDKYGVDESSSSATTKKRKNAKKEATEEDEEDEEDADGKKKEKKITKTQIFKNYENQPVHDQLMEMSRYYFGQKEMFKGSVYTKACAAIREHDDTLTTAKQAAKLKGIGKAIASMIEEYNTTGMIVKLEQMRAGTN